MCNQQPHQKSSGLGHTTFSQSRVYLKLSILSAPAVLYPFCKPTTPFAPICRTANLRARLVINMPNSLSGTNPINSSSPQTTSFFRGLLHSRSGSDNSPSMPPPTSNSDSMRRKPDWLVKFLDDKDYRARVLEELSERERLRAEYRNAPSLEESTIPSSSLPALDVLPSLSKSKKLAKHQRLLNFYATRAGSSAMNHGLNRYTDVVPYDRHSVYVKSRFDEAGARDRDDNTIYLNASWVKERSGIWWCAAQGM